MCRLTGERSLSFSVVLGFQNTCVSNVSRLSLRETAWDLNWKNQNLVTKMGLKLIILGLFFDKLFYLMTFTDFRSCSCSFVTVPIKI